MSWQEFRNTTMDHPLPALLETSLVLTKSQCPLLFTPSDKEGKELGANMLSCGRYSQL